MRVRGDARGSLWLWLTLGLLVALAGCSGNSAAGKSVPAASLTCTVHTSAGSDDDEVKQTLSCMVTHAKATDTSFSLHYGLVDPLGHVRPFDKTCDGSLHNGSGSCTQAYEFIVPFRPAPAPVTGELLPSHVLIHPATPMAN
jgi:hypothetical protein